MGRVALLLFLILWISFSPFGEHKISIYEYSASHYSPNKYSLGILGINGTSPPALGDWVISDVTVVERVKLIINGSIIVNSSGALILKDSTILLNVSTNGEHYIDVYGNLTLVNTTIASLDPTNKYYFRINTNAFFLMENSTVRDVGYSSLGIGDKAGLWISTDGAVIRNSRVVGYYGVYLYRANNTVVEGSTLEGSIYSLFLFESHNNTFVGNTFSGSIYGVKLKSSPGNRIINNTFGWSTWDGLTLSSSSNSIIINNTFSGSGAVFYDSYNNTVANNTVNGLPLLYLEGASSMRVNGLFGQVILVGCKNITVLNVSVSDTAVGIELWSTNNSFVANNTISDSDRGILVGRSYNNVVMYNTISGGSKGIALNNAGENKIVLNSISVPFGYGIYGYYGATNNNITLNNITAYTAIFSYEGDNQIYLNNIKGTSPYIAYGTNKLYSQNPIRYVYGNLTLEGLLGNYWSNYLGNDTDGDGVGEEAFNIDLYPLIGRAYISDGLVHIEALIYLWIETPEDEYLSNSTIVVSWRYINGTSAPLRFDLYVDGTLFEANISIDETSRILSLGEGVHNITITALDPNGNVVRYYKNITVDMTPPTVEFGERHVVTNSRNISIAWSASDNLSGIDHYELYVDGARLRTLMPFQTLVFLNLSEGQHEVRIVAYDRAGNRAEDTMIIIADYTPPTIQVLAPVNNTITNQTTIIVRWNTTDNLAGISSIELYIDSAVVYTSLPPNTSEYRLDLPEGKHYINIRAIDKAGNTKTAIIKVVTDYNPPTLLILKPNNETVLDKTPVFVLWFGNDSLAGVDHYELLVDGTIVNSSIPPYVMGYIVNLTYGRHSIEIRAVDRAGNIAKGKIVITVKEQTMGERTTESHEISELFILLVPLIIAVVAVLAILIKKKKR